MHTLRLILSTFLVAILSTSCAVDRATAYAEPTFHWSTIKSIHIVKYEDESGGTRERIAQKLKAYGFKVTIDPDPNPGADALLLYQDEWRWDFTWFLLQLDVTIRDPKTNFPYASANALHGSTSRKTDQEMVDEVIDNLMKLRK